MKLSSELKQCLKDHKLDHFRPVPGRGISFSEKEIESVCRLMRIFSPGAAGGDLSGNITDFSWLLFLQSRNIGPHKGSPVRIPLVAAGAFGDL
jgi:hypothetical protein